MQKGNIGVTTENIFPIIKKFLYSDHEIFLRELVSNAVECHTETETLASKVNSKERWEILLLSKFRKRYHHHFRPGYRTYSRRDRQIYQSDSFFRR